MTTRPLVAVFDADDGKTINSRVPLPAVFSVPVRADIVQDIHTNVSKNRRQGQGVNDQAGMKHSAESWGTGRAVARIPRVSGSGTHRSGQAAFGNMCRKGRMFAPLKTWRRWHRKVNIKQKRHAVAASLAASAIVPLVQARGHRISNVPELPLVVSDKLESYDKTKDAVKFLKRVGAYDDVQKVIDTKAIRAGKGKLRNRRYRLRKGPLVVYSNENTTLRRALRNIPGVEITNVNRLNLLQLAPGGQVGRFIIYTESAFKALNNVFGTYKAGSQQKDGYNLNRSVMTNADLARIINSNVIQSVVRNARQNQVLHTIQKKNPLKNNNALFRLNPYAKTAKANAKKAQEDAIKNKKANVVQRRKISKANHKGSAKWISNYRKNIAQATKAAKEEEIDWINQGLIQ